MKKFIYALMFLALFFTTPMFALQEDTGGFEISQLLTLLNPAIVFFAVQASKKIIAFNSTVILAVLVPGLSLLGSWLIGLVVPDTSFFVTFLVGLASTFVYELYKQLSGANV